MGSRGAPPKPTALRILQGNPGKIKLNADEPAPKLAAIDLRPPEWLDKSGQEIWKRLRPDLPWLTVADLDAFAAFCNSYSRWREAEGHVAGEGMIFVIRDAPTAQEAKRGEKGAIKYIQQNPHVGIAKAYAAQMRGFAGELGLTPASRSRIHVPDDKSKSGERDGFFKTA
jgi:P27 family predicted phage terminase small subunit